MKFITLEMGIVEEHYDLNPDIVVLSLVWIIMPSFEEVRVYCFAHVGWSVGRSLGRSVVL
jgi:hypothetical protein